MKQASLELSELEQTCDISEKSSLTCVPPTYWLLITNIDAESRKGHYSGRILYVRYIRRPIRDVSDHLLPDASSKRTDLYSCRRQSYTARSLETLCRGSCWAVLQRCTRHPRFSTPGQTARPVEPSCKHRAGCKESRSHQAWRSRRHEHHLLVKKESATQVLSPRDLIPSDLTVPFNDSVTLTTHATHEFLQHVPVLCSRWQGPVSVAVYAPGTDYAVALDKIALLRHCGDPCVRANVSWHVMFDKNHAPPRAAMVNGSSSAAFLRSWNGSCNSDAMEREYAKFREAHNLTYPINVLRNVARRRARTRYVLASDVELYPSANVIPRFLNLVAERRRRNATETGTPEVYVLPVFEVDAKQRPPLTKRVLVEMLRNKTAVFFHKWTCDRCHKFPKREQWIEHVPFDENHLGIFTTAKRDRTNSFWEPIFIGTNDDPFYKEAFNWEGKRDKMSHSYELCLRGYNFHILDNAFLVHAPGIKTVRASYDMRRTPFVRKNEVRDALMRRHLWHRHPAFAKNC
ncbi:hypothetical protein HPB50_019483 [Hyalomma asiaticum]|uniref:Uncharacterized protein n=1 Tax=Hyalomma asiaticum TaxID=266040 RepID=A0ACB7SJ03_HYAAI|nr:hypothetical protein HPB50_019483 [Hyalomma asiaticum]